MSEVQTAENLTELAKSRALADRERLMLGVVDLCAQSSQRVRAPAKQALLSPILLSLITGALRSGIRAITASMRIMAQPPAPRGD